jgi:glycosyltransferase involved in cell wall biosynthesis
MAMRIAVNGQRLAGQPFGVGRYIEYLVRGWSELLQDGEELHLFVRRPLSPELANLGPRIKPIVLESNLSGLPWENLVLRGAASKLDVLFCPAYSAPIIFNRPLVVATHSVNETEAAAHSWLYNQTYSRLYKYCARRADAVIVPGAATLRAVRQRYGVPESKLHVVHQGADDSFHPIDDPELLRATRVKFFGSDRPYVLFVGKCSPRRNIPLLIEAFARLRATTEFPHGLVIFGPDKCSKPIPALCAALGVAEDVVQTDGIVEHHSDLVPVYAAADVFVHPSENEGWSMTTVEAMACGTPIIASNRGGLREVAEGYALMLDPPSVDSLVDAMRKVLSDQVLRERLKHLARERGKALRWVEIARQTLDIIRDVGSRERRA